MRKSCRDGNCKSFKGGNLGGFRAIVAQGPRRSLGLLQLPPSPLEESLQRIARCAAQGFFRQLQGCGTCDGAMLKGAGVPPACGPETCVPKGPLAAGRAILIRGLGAMMRFPKASACFAQPRGCKLKTGSAWTSKRPCGTALPLAECLGRVRLAPVGERGQGAKPRAWTPRYVETFSGAA